MPLLAGAFSYSNVTREIWKREPFCTGVGHTMKLIS
jgi:hypothetical protein